MQPLMYNYNQHAIPGQGHGQLPQSLQQDPGVHNGNTMGHHSGFSSGVIANTSPFTQNNLQNGHGPTPAATPGQGQMSEFRAVQISMQKESEKAHLQMTNPQQPQPHYYARIKATENKGIGALPSSGDGTNSSDQDGEDRRRPWSTEQKRQNWMNLDMSGQGLRRLSSPIFDYYFLQKVYLVSNNLSELPAAIGQLRQLRILNVSYNQLTELPDEVGMCTFLKQLLAFNNRISQVSSALGSLHNLNVLGLEGNPLDQETSTMLMERGTKAFIQHLKETSPGRFCFYSVQRINIRINAKSLCSKQFPCLPKSRRCC